MAAENLQGQAVPHFLLAENPEKSGFLLPGMVIMF
jgi:hypothetical protein